MFSRNMPYIPDFQKYYPVMDRSFDWLVKDNDLAQIRRAAETGSHYRGALDENE
jgi:hypothetical protein